MIDRVEVAADLTDDQRRWIAETERRLADMERRILAGEPIDLSGWQSRNWLDKVSSGF